MKKIITAALIQTALCITAMAALDTSTQYHESVLPAESTTLLQTPVSLLPIQGTTNGVAATGSEITLTDYPGTALLVIPFGTGIHSTYTGTVSVAFGTSTGVYTTTNSYTQTGTTAGKYTSAEVNLDTLQGTNAALFGLATFTVVAGGALDTFAYAGASLIYGAARATTQTNTGSAVDTINYKGMGTIIVDVGSPINGSSAYTNIVTIQRAAATTGTWATVSSVTNTAADVDEIAYEFGKGGRYIRAVVTTINDAGPVSVTLNSFK